MIAAAAGERLLSFVISETKESGGNNLHKFVLVPAGGVALEWWHTAPAFSCPSLWCWPCFAWLKNRESSTPIGLAGCRCRA
jgi:hypothetical protein